MEACPEMSLKTHLCNCCGKKTEVYTMEAKDGSLFNLCVPCGMSFLQDILTNMKLSEISDKLRKK